MRTTPTRSLWKIMLSLLLGIIVTTPQAFSQVEYCIPLPGYVGMTYEYNYADRSVIMDVNITNAATNELIFDNRTDQVDEGDYGWGYKHFKDLLIELSPGETYNLSVETYGYYRIYQRLFIDWNGNGVFTNLDQWQEYYGYKYYFIGWPTYWGTRIGTFTFTVPETDQETVRIRVMSSYYNQYYYKYGVGGSYRYDDPCYNGYVADYISAWGYGYYYMYGEVEDYTAQVGGGVKEGWPGKGEILYANEAYDGTTRLKNGVDTEFPKPYVIFSGDPKPEDKITYKIQGPAPSEEVVYQGLEPFTQDEDEISVGSSTVDKKYTLEHAKGKYSFPVNYGDGTFKADRGGTYKITTHMVGTPRVIVNAFTVAFDDDLSVDKVTMPKQLPDKYVLGQAMRPKAVIRNVGINDVSEFYTIMELYNPDGILTERDSVYYSAPPREILKTADNVEVQFSTSYVNEVGAWELKCTAHLLSSDDDDDYNDVLPRPDAEDYFFTVAYNFQVASHEIHTPSADTTFFAKRPFVPVVEFKNHGISDASYTPATLEVYEFGTTTKVHEEEIVISEIPQGRYNSRIVKFTQMKIDDPGTYEMVVTVNHPDDPVADDDVIKQVFEVIPGLQGTWTVGQTNLGNERNFGTIQDLMDAIYLKGITGDLRVELTDAEYTMNSGMGDDPAWDFSSKIIGLGEQSPTVTNSITFVPSVARASTRAGIKINLNTESGIGILFGQNIMPTNKYALFNNGGKIADANSAGYISFDGGSQKAIKFVLNSTNEIFGSTFYFNKGSENISVKNCIIENGTTAIQSMTDIPFSTYNPTTGTFYDPDFMYLDESDDLGYSSAVTIRSKFTKHPDNEALNKLEGQLDTIPSNNILIEGNEVSGFAYGVISLGFGPLLNVEQAEYIRYYNHDNKIIGNKFNNIYKEAVFLGYEENTEIKNNRIYNVGGYAESAAGIRLGMQSLENKNGYNNLNISIIANEISGLSSGSQAAGVFVDQARVQIQASGGGVINFPDENENTIITNNVIWDVTANNSNANVAGILLQTARDTEAGNSAEVFMSPKVNDYWTDGDKISNNTIILSDDAGVENQSILSAIAISNANGTEVKNNAILIEDASISNDAIATAIYNKGRTSENGGIVSDRNAFWLGNTNSTIFRFIETDEDNTVLEFGERNEFKVINQWRYWTGNDQNSIVGDFSADFAYAGNDPQNLVIKMFPNAPKGSFLNNRGERLEYVNKDIKGKNRGDNQQRYDIGAQEFDGIMYISDIEMLDITEPHAYKSSSNEFSDCEYIMTEAPVDVMASIRNNGALLQQNVKFNVNIYIEDPNNADAYLDSAVVAIDRAGVNVASTESSVFSFNLNDGTETFVPQTYAELDDYDVPARFQAMEMNVTPKYKIEVIAQSDEFNDNNKVTKEVRFYIKKSGLKLMVTGEHASKFVWSTTPAPATADEIAGRLNIDALIETLRTLGWYNDPDTDRFEVDIFDRTNWEPKAVDYRMYRSVYWADGDDKKTNRYERMNIEEFLNAGEDGNMKNLVIGSQEMVRELFNEDNGVDGDMEFSKNILRAMDVDPSNPNGYMQSTNGSEVEGVAVAQSLRELIRITDFSIDLGNGEFLTDVEPMSGLVEVVEDGYGLAQVAYRYTNALPDLDSYTMGVANTSPDFNMIYLGVDWRHFANLERVMRATFDYIGQTSVVVGAELSDFDARAIGKRVDITWATVSEEETSYFEVEKANVNESGVSNFEAIAKVKAQGNSDKLHEYAPVRDYDVNYGNEYAYRLKVVDLNGEVEYSEQRNVRIGFNSGLVSLSDVYPNPAKDQANFTLTLDENADVNVELYDINGNIVLSKVYTNVSGQQEIRLDLNGLASGSYRLMVKFNGTVLDKAVNVVK